MGAPLLVKATWMSDERQLLSYPQNKPPGLGKTVDGSEIWRENQLRLIVYPIIYEGFLHPRWLFEISYINSVSMFT